MRNLIGASAPSMLSDPPKTLSEWESVVKQLAAQAVARLPRLQQQFGVHIEQTEFSGVAVFEVVSKRALQRDRRRLLHIHGGCYVLNPGEAGLSEAILMARFGGFRVVSVDYRMPPTAYFPAAFDDVTTAWTALATTTDPKATGRHVRRRRTDACARPADQKRGSGVTGSARPRHANGRRHQDW
jgi:epsilon-lactone hydrolase